MVCLQSSFAQKNLAWEKSQSIRVKSASADLWCQCLPCFTTHICALCANSTSSWYEGNKELLFLEGTQKNNLSHTWISSKEDQPHVSKSKEDKSFVSAAMRYTLLSRKGREEGAERKRAQPIIFYFFFLRKKMMCNSRRRRPCRSPYFHPSQQGLCQRSDRTTQKYPTNSRPRVRSRGTAASRNLRPRLCSRHLLHRGSRAGTGASGREEASTRWEGSGEAGWRLDGGWMEPVGARRGPPGGETGPAAAGAGWLPCSCLHLLLLPASRAPKPGPQARQAAWKPARQLSLQALATAWERSGEGKTAKNRTIELDLFFFFFLLFKPNFQERCHLPSGAPPCYSYLGTLLYSV